MSARPCPHRCGALVLGIAKPGTRAAERVWLDAREVRASSSPPVGSFGDTTKIPALVVFNRHGEREMGGGTVVAPAYLDAQGEHAGHTVHRFTCPNWPAMDKARPVQRFERVRVAPEQEEKPAAKPARKRSNQRRK